jgi:NO-binding membrane sensor protein with MHYT domain
MSMSGSYDPVLVVLSVAVAIFGSFTGLNLAGRLVAADRSTQPWWLMSAALALGGGIWSMHFVGMLAFSMPMPASYDVRLTLLSLALPIVVTGAGFLTVSRWGTGWASLLGAGVLAGLGVVVMHYSGMAAMRMPGVVISYDPLLVAASVGIAIVAATAAFWLAFRMERTRERLIAAIVMGLAIAGMHYTAMAAARFTMHGHADTVASVIHPDVLAMGVVGTTSLLLFLGLITAYFDRKLATLTAREAEALQQSERRFRALIENSSDIIAILHKEGTFAYESSSARHILGYRTRDFVGRPLTDFV